MNKLILLNQLRTVENLSSLVSTNHYLSENSCILIAAALPNDLNKVSDITIYKK